jgi:hypothetical protein
MVHVTEELTPRHRNIALSALWVWRSQLGRVGSGQTVPGLASEAAIKEIEEVARLLGGNPESYCFGVDPSRRD